MRATSSTSSSSAWRSVRSPCRSRRGSRARRRVLTSCSRSGCGPCRGPAVPGGSGHHRHGGGQSPGRGQKDPRDRPIARDRGPKGHRGHRRRRARRRPRQRPAPHHHTVKHGAEIGQPLSARFRFVARGPQANALAARRQSGPITLPTNGITAMPTMRPRAPELAAVTAHSTSPAAIGVAPLAAAARS
jgi:hypothetical protein